jgi:dCMP deaminase
MNNNSKQLDFSFYTNIKTNIEFSNYIPPDWNPWFLQGVYWVASKSKDPKTKIGALIVKDKRIVSTGYNGIPSGVIDTIERRSERPEKYKWYEHAERNAIFAAAKYGIPTEGSTLYTNALPCADCARGIIQSGIKEIYIHRQFTDLCDNHEREQWCDHESVSLSLFNECDLPCYVIDAVLGCKAYFDGKIFDV